MIIRLDDSLTELADPVDGVSTNALEILLRSHQDGLHLLVANRRTWIAISNLSGFSRFNYQLLQKMTEQSAHTAGMMLSPIPGLRIVYNEPQIHKDGIFQLRELTNMDHVARSVIIAENLTDLDYFEHLAQVFLDEEGISLPMAFDKQAGGGNTISDVFRECIRARRLTLCITDSDKKYPSCRIGNTAQRCIRVNSEEAYFKKLFVSEDFREIENIVPIRLLREALADDCESKISTIADLPNDHKKYIDMKDGLKSFEIFSNGADEDFRDFWGSALVENEHCGQVCPTGCLTKSQCSNYIYQGLGQRVMPHVNRTLSRSSKRDISSFFKGDQIVNWREIAAEFAYFALSGGRVSVL